MYTEVLEKIKSSSLEQILLPKYYETFDDDNIESLYYIIPLIERLIIEYCDLTPNIIVENKEKDAFKTVGGLLEDNIISQEFGDELTENILFIFKEDGIRNKLMHYSEDYLEIKLKRDELHMIKYTAFVLAYLYAKKADETNKKELEKIPLLGND